MVNGYRPNTLEEALIIRREKEAVPYAGGTDLMVRKDESNVYLFLDQIKELQEVREDNDNIYIGAACIYSDLLHNKIIPEILKMAIHAIASPAIRNAATIGGNIGNASPAGDTLPVLYVLNAKLKIRTMDSVDEVPMEDFILGPKRTTLTRDAIIEEIIIPKKRGAYPFYYQKIGARKADAISKLSFAGVFLMEDGIISDIACAFGAVGPTVIRDKSIEHILLGKTIEEAGNIADNVIEQYAAILHPIDDQRSTAVYRKKVCLNLLKDFLDKIRT
ncbi:MAG: xanthine dehydrogenase family protein subunit [Lachnospiraceae bacterium]|jgi:CO/xanthine dehydrogenase FAD-binding subunit|nr:xanthine dehydrogenase family protein subunit [Lachnospiraceae bacterium]